MRENCEKEELAYRLVEGEFARRLERPMASLRYSVLPCVGRRAASVLFLHGAASNGSRWEEFIENTRLRKNCDLIRCDLRGHGSSTTSRPARLEDWCSDAEAILKAENICEAIVVGHSLGAQVALNFAVRHAERTRGIVLLDPLVSEALTPKAARMRSRLPVFKIVEFLVRCANALGLRRRLEKQDLRAMDARAREKIAAGGRELEAFIKQYSSAGADLRYMHAADYLHDFVETGRPTPDAQSVRVPVLVIGALSGTFTDAGALRAWVDKLYDGEMAVVRCAHWPMTECPDEVARVIESWIFRRFSTLESEAPEAF